jgi:hypothetical protein
MFFFTMMPWSKREPTRLCYMGSLFSNKAKMPYLEFFDCPMGIFLIFLIDKKCNTIGIIVVF